MKVGQSIVIGDVLVYARRVWPNNLKLAIRAPKGVKIQRLKNED